MIEQLILQALQTAAIVAIGTIGAPNVYPIKAMGRTGPNAAQAPDGNYWEFVNISNNRSGDYYGDERVYQGNFRIILHWKVDDSGAYPPMALVDTVGAFFPKGKAFPAGAAMVRIYDVPSASGPVEGNSELLFPLSLAYRCFAL